MSGVPVLATSESAQDVSPRIGIEKRCSKCKKIKLLTEFSTNGNRYKSACKLCRNAMPVDRAKSNESTRRWRENHIDRARELAKKNRVKRREKCRAELSIWRAKNPDKVRILQQRSLKVRMSKPIFKLDASIRGRIWNWKKIREFKF